MKSVSLLHQSRHIFVAPLPTFKRALRCGHPKEILLSQESALPLRPVLLTQIMTVFYARGLNSLVKTSFRHEKCKASLRNSQAPYSFAWEINLGPGQFFKQPETLFWVSGPTGWGPTAHWGSRQKGPPGKEKLASNGCPAPQLSQQHESECYRNKEIPFINFRSPQLKSFRSHKVDIQPEDLQLSN